MLKHNVLILCGGKGSRLRSVWQKPKILAPIAETNYLNLILNSFSELDINLNVFLATGFQSNIIEKYVYDENISCSIIKENTPLGTGGALLNYLESFDVERLTVMNGDTIYNLRDLKCFFRKSINSKKNIIGTARIKINDRYGSLSIDNSFNLSKNEGTVLNDLVFTGIATVNCKSLIKKVNFPLSLESLLNKSKLNKDDVEIVNFKKGFFDIGTPEAINSVEEWLTKN
jgi:D-glycero-alpha-D-manno-heptose 1-phosphate guanylyltransferase